MLTELLLLDIETVPGFPSFADMDSGWQSLFLDKIAKTVPEHTDSEEIYRKKAGILAEFGKIICISTAFFYEEADGHMALKMKSIYGNNEVEILSIFTDLCNKMQQHHRHFQFGGHNIKEFDIPYICRRLLINGLPLPECLQLHDKKPWEVKMFDTLNWWKFGDNKNYVSLHLLAMVLGIPSSKSDIDGSMVQDVYYKEKNLPRIVVYCQRDVVVTANIILRFMSLPLLSDARITIVDGP
ncbi:MAG: ribonuclease H-like domain-containing protein [Bacteroidota bacterium]